MRMGSDGEALQLGYIKPTPVENPSQLFNVTSSRLCLGPPAETDATKSQKKTPSLHRSYPLRAAARNGYNAGCIVTQSFAAQQPPISIPS